MTQQCLISILQRPSAVGGLLRGQQPASRRNKYSQVVRGLGSVDGGSEDEDTKLVREFEILKNKVDPQNNAKLAAHLNLIWSVSEVCYIRSEKLYTSYFRPISFVAWLQLPCFIVDLVANFQILPLVQRKRPERCDCCAGSGERECAWCHGTGAMTVGDTLFCTHEGCRPCPVCRGNVSVQI